MYVPEAAWEGEEAISSSPRVSKVARVSFFTFILLKFVKRKLSSFPGYMHYTCQNNKVSNNNL